MNYLKLSWKNSLARPWSSVLSITLLGLGVCLISLMLLVSKQLENTLSRNITGIDMVLGAKGSPLQLILSAIFQIDAPTGNIKLKEANYVAKSPLVKQAIPLSYGDSYQGYRIVGSTHPYVDLYDAKLAQGKLWNAPFEITAGARVAKVLNLKLGDTFHSQHGFEDEGEAHDHHTFKVVGILAPSNSVLDQLLLTSTESVWQSHHHEEDHGHEDEEHKHEHGTEEHKHKKDEHEHKHDEHGHHEHEHKKGEHKHDEEHDEHKHEHEGHEHKKDEHEREEEESHLEEREITAMLVQFRSPLGKLQVPRIVNEQTKMQSAVPHYEVYRLLDLMGVGIQLLNGLAFCILIVSGLSVFINLYNALRERKYEMALLRNYGAPRWRLMQVLVQEGLTLSILGFVFGILLSRLGLWVFGNVLTANYGYQINLGNFLIEELYLLIAAIGIGIFAAVIPAIRVYVIDIARTLGKQ
ncbi:MAG: ABC transporter permease [Flammeovirgaceae bacterium]